MPRGFSMAKIARTFSSDDDTLTAADKLFSSFGIDTETAINLFLHQAVMEQSLPFAIRIPSRTAESLSSIGEHVVCEERASVDYSASEHIHSLPEGTILAHPEGSYSSGGQFSCPGSDFGAFGDDDEEIGCQG